MKKRGDISHAQPALARMEVPRNINTIYQEKSNYSNGHLNQDPVENRTDDIHPINRNGANAPCDVKRLEAGRL